MPAFNNGSFFNRIEISLLPNVRLRQAAKYGRFCHGELLNFANWPTEFGKVVREKLWALFINCQSASESNRRMPQQQ